MPRSSKSHKSSSKRRHPSSMATSFVINAQPPKRPIHRKTPVYAAKKTQLIIVLVVCLGVFLMVIVGKIYSGKSAEKPASSSSNTQSESNNQPEVVTKDEGSNNQISQNSSLQEIISNSKFDSVTVVKLSVPVYKQVYGQSCEASALRMVLAYHDIKVTDMELLNQMGYDGKTAKTVDGQVIWGDPHKQFVGDKDGDQADLTGYGVYAEPIAAAAQENGRAAEISDDAKISWIAQQIYAGNPVILWGVSIKTDDATWKTADGDTIDALRRTHTRLVVGFKGDPASPDGFYLNDPALGAMKYWTTSALQNNIDKGIKQAVAVK